MPISTLEPSAGNASDSIFWRPAHRFQPLTKEEQNSRRAIFGELLQVHFPALLPLIGRYQNLTTEQKDLTFVGKFERIFWSTSVIERVLASPQAAPAFGRYLELVLETLLQRVQGIPTDFESLGMLDHYITLQKMAELAIPELTLEGMLCFGEFAVVRKLLSVGESEKFWRSANQSLLGVLETHPEQLLSLKRCLQMPHRVFRPHDVDKIEPVISQGLVSPLNASTEQRLVHEYADALKHWRSPVDIVKWAGQHYAYDFDRGALMSASYEPRINPPEIFFDRKSGVCIDFSNFIVSTLRKIAPQITPYYFRMEYRIPNLFRGAPFRSHWSAAYQAGDEWYVLGDSKLGGTICGPYQQLDDYREDYSRFRGLYYYKCDLYEQPEVFYTLVR